MAAQVESMASVREVPWHGIGTVLDGYASRDEMIRAAELDWTVEFRRLHVGGLYVPDDHEQIDSVPEFAALDGFYAVVRSAPAYPDRDGDVFSVAKSRYRFFQNEDIFQFGLDVIEQAGSFEGAEFETAGALSGGRTIFVTLKIPGDIKIAGADSIEKYLVLASSHDGTKPFLALKSNVRVVCANTLNMALAGTQNRVVVRHTTNLKDRVEEAKRVLGFASRYEEEFAATMAKLAEADYTMAEFEKLAATLFPVKDEAKDSANKNAQLALIGNYVTSPTLGATKETRYGALNAVTEYTQWARKYNNGDRTVAERQTESNWFGSNLTLGQSALDILTADLGGIASSKPKRKRQVLTNKIA
jgi:phage/plasmid-like protein (TIGR03299 family)